jgi:hypothetical protein
VLTAGAALYCKAGDHNPRQSRYGPEAWLVLDLVSGRIAYHVTDTVGGVRAEEWYIEACQGQLHGRNLAGLAEELAATISRRGQRSHGPQGRRQSHTVTDRRRREDRELEPTAPYGEPTVPLIEAFPEAV